MASTIIIKNGAGGSTPSSLQQGELAINVDSGSLYYGTSGSSNTVSSSFYIANLTASGAISASGTITANTISAESNHRINDSGGTSRHVLRRTDTNTLELGNTNFDEGLLLTGNITASGNISASGTLFGENITIGSGNVIMELGAGTDNSVVVLNSDNKLITDEIRPEVWGNSGAIVTTEGENVAPTANSATIATTVTANSTTDNAEFFIGVLDGDSGGQSVETSTLLKQNPSTGKLTVLGDISSSGVLNANTVQLAHNGVNTLNVSNAGAISASSTIQGTALTIKGNGSTYASISATGDVEAKGDISSSALMSAASLEIKAAGVHKASIDASGNVATEGNISSSTEVFGRALTLATAGEHSATIDASGNIAAEGTISSSGLMSATSLDIRTAGVQKAAIDVDGNFTANLLSAPAIQSNTDITYTADADGNEIGQHIFKDRTTLIATLDVEQASFVPSITSSSDISASGTLAGTALTLATAGVTKAAITSDGSASFDGGIDIGYNSTASLGYISASQLIIQGTDENAAIVLKDNDHNSIAQFSRVGSGANAHIGQMQLRDNADIKVRFKANDTCFVSNDFSSSAALLGNTAQFAHNGINTLNISNAGAISASSTILGTTFTAQTNGERKATIDASGNIAAEGTISSSGLMSATSLDIKSAGVTKTTIDASGNIAAEGDVSSSGALSGTSLSLTVNGASVRTGLITHYNLIGYGTGDGTNFEFAKNMATNTAPFNHELSFGSDGLTAQTVQTMIRMGGIFMNRACTLTKWSGWSTCQGNGTANIALFKITPTRNSNTNLSAVLLHDYSYTALGNTKMEDFDLTSFTVSSIAAGDMIISGIKSVSGQLQFFTSMFEVEFS